MVVPKKRREKEDEKNARKLSDGKIKRYISCI